MPPVSERLPKMSSDHRSLAVVVLRRVAGGGCLLLALLLAFAGVFAAIGGPDGKLGSAESIRWAAGYAVGFLLSAAASWWLLRRRRG